MAGEGEGDGCRRPSSKLQGDGQPGELRADETIGHDVGLRLVSHQQARLEGPGRGRGLRQARALRRGTRACEQELLQLGGIIISSCPCHPSSPSPAASPAGPSPAGPVARAAVCQAARWIAPWDLPAEGYVREGLSLQVPVRI